MSMTIEVPIPDDMIPRLEQKARSAGLDREQYVRALVSRDLAGPRTFDEILGGFREEVVASGMSDSELDQLFESARQDSLAEQKNCAGNSRWQNTGRASFQCQFNPSL